ncbi:hypothetical protein COHA_000037 [Chlorella ohadii]|uniref:Peptidase S8/S53 domain-containing protein n=1 Tax=Chlorella ohadii TaxID=2649997 RepID=A0AAD5H6R6_9CHLO|nr:hypothetical protein COHA_000037 [Chlorella ohadii]
MQSTLNTVAVLLALALVLHGQARAEPPYAEGRLIVLLKPQTPAAAQLAGSSALPSGLSLERVLNGATAAAANTAAAAAGAAVASAAQAGTALLVTITDGASVADKLRQLRANKAVAAASPDYMLQSGSPALFRGLHRALAGSGGGAGEARRRGGRGGRNPRPFPNDPLFSQQWHWPAVNAPSAWRTSTGSQTVRMCIIDTGALMGCKSASGACNAPAPGTPAFFNFNDSYSHGTSTCGVMAAVGNNGVGLAGVNWKLSLYVCKHEGGGRIWFSAQLECYALCTQAGVRAISASWGAYQWSDIEYQAVKRLGQNGVMLIAGAGNDGLNNDALAPSMRFYPASHLLPNVIAVGGSDQTSDRCFFSNYGKSLVHLVAPSVGIWTTSQFAVDPTTGQITPNVLYSNVSGTSFSTPMTAGVAALLWAARPGLTYQQVRRALLSTVTKRAALKPYVRSGGILNIAAALAAVWDPQRLPWYPVVVPPYPTKPPATFAVEANTFYNISFGGSPSTHASATAMPDWQTCQTFCSDVDWCHWFIYYAQGVPGVFNPGTTCLLLQRTSSTVLLRKQPLTGCVSGSKTSGR